MSGLSPASPADMDNSPPLAGSEGRLDGVSADVARQAVTWLVELQSAKPGSGIERAILDWRGAGARPSQRMSAPGSASRRSMPGWAGSPHRSVRRWRRRR